MMTPWMRDLTSLSVKCDQDSWLWWGLWPPDDHTAGVSPNPAHSEHSSIPPPQSTARAGPVLMAVMTGKLIYAVTRHSQPASFLVWPQSTIIHHISLITSDPHIWRYSFLQRGAHVITLRAGRVESRDPSLNCQVLLLRPQLTTD